MKALTMNVKMLLLACCAVAISACGSDSDGGGMSKEEKDFTESLIGIWFSDTCEDDGGYWSITKFEFTDSGKIRNFGTEYNDDECSDVRGTWDEGEGDYKIGDKVDEGEGGASGYEIDVTIGDQTYYTLISKVYSDDGDYFFLGAVIEDSGQDASKPENRPENFDTEIKYEKQ